MLWYCMGGSVSIKYTRSRKKASRKRIYFRDFPPGLPVATSLRDYELALDVALRVHMRQIILFTRRTRHLRRIRRIEVQIDKKQKNGGPKQNRLL